MNTVILNNQGQVVATLRKNMRNRKGVKYAYHKCKEQINANREFNLVNAQSGVTSNDLKYSDDAAYAPLAEEINLGEYYIDD